MHKLRFGVIGLGLMGREFASAAARWLHLTTMSARPVITAVCDTNPQALQWFRDHVPSLTLATTDYHELLASDIDAVYCAVPHHLHAKVYTAIIEAGKHLLGEKPFGIDLDANAAINATLEAHPEVFVRCSSEMPFFPGALQLARAVKAGKLGRIISVEAAFLHASDLNPDKPINWKRQVATNGSYGVMGDLGMHVLHLPLRFGWLPRRVSAVLSNLVPERPDGQGGVAACDTWDNATLLTQVVTDSDDFPMLLHLKRIAPGETNTWSLKVHGTKMSLEFSTKYPKTLRMLEYAGAAQAWQHLDLGYESAYPAITGSIFEFGFSDAILQMWAAFVDELVNGENMRGPLGCVTPQEAAISHQIFTAALQAHEQGITVTL